jgi:nucleoside-diphosphate-sugar epimerase
MAEGILVTGSEGLIGRALRRALEERGESVVSLDLRAPQVRDRGDVRVAAEVAIAMASCRGVVHLAAVSRVVDGERDPAVTEVTNVGGTVNVLDAARSFRRSWVIFASSREVYGSPARLPVTEDAPLAPVNVYGRSKVTSERMVAEARACGLRASTIRLSNVYGNAADHATRVVPAFARAALAGEPLRVEGSSHTFDFTHIDDVVNGIITLIDVLDGDAEAPLPIHFVSGAPTTLAQLADLCIELARSRSKRVEAPPRTYDVPHFHGNPARARAILGWRPTVTLRDGIARLLADLAGRSAREGASR